MTLLVLDDINLDIRAGEVVALLGRSGCGKSTLLRIIAGLIAPTSGVARYDGAELTGANPGTAMVFQNFALMPWLTVQKNVELGLAARKIAPAERSQRAVEAIDLIGLDGFESAYPKELSGGMRQRVGFARALVLQPDLLLMDEPFSALDVLTAENLRSELMSLWTGQEFPTKAICLVTHNIEEAIVLADRVIVLSSNPGRILAEFPIELERPRDRRSPSFEALVDKLYGLLTGTGPATTLVEPGTATPTSHPLPRATVGGLAGLVEIVYGKGGRVDIPDIAADLGIDAKDLLPLVDAAALLDFVRVSGADLELTADRQGFHHRRHPNQQADLRPTSTHPRTAGAHHLPRSARLPRRQPARRILPRHPPTGIQRPGRPAATRHRHRLGPLRRTLRLQHQHRPDHGGPQRHARDTRASRRAAGCGGRVAGDFAALA